MPVTAQTDSACFHTGSPQSRLAGLPQVCCHFCAPPLEDALVYDPSWTGPLSPPGPLTDPSSLRTHGIRRIYKPFVLQSNECVVTGLVPSLCIVSLYGKDREITAFLHVKKCGDTQLRAWGRLRNTRWTKGGDRRAQGP